MAVTIYHNPRCSKSRATLKLIESAGINHEIVIYRDDMPDAPRLLSIANLLGVPVSDLLRRGESDFKEANDLPELADDTAVADWLAAHPIVLQRPIVVDWQRERAVIGRPPENVLPLLR